MCLTGKWSAETRLRAPRAIIEEYLLPASRIKYSNRVTSVEAFHTLASYADEQYRMIVEKMLSPDYLVRRKYMISYFFFF